jgi:hypothetical protein
MERLRIELRGERDDSLLVDANPFGTSESLPYRKVLQITSVMPPTFSAIGKSRSASL